MAWWLWILLSLGLLVVELVTPGGLFALFFGAAALLVAPLAAVGLGDIWQWLVFSAASIAALVTLRRPLAAKLQRDPPAPIDAIVGEEAVLLEDLAAGGTARAELRGVPWSARSDLSVPLAAGQRCRVERVEDLTLWVTAE